MLDVKVQRVTLVPETFSHDFSNERQRAGASSPISKAVLDRSIISWCRSTCSSSEDLSREDRLINSQQSDGSADECRISSDAALLPEDQLTVNSDLLHQ